MSEQIKVNLRKFLIVAAIFVSCSGFAVLADAEPSEIYEANLPELNEQTDEKPVFRCPKILFALARSGCHQVKKGAAKKAESDRQTTAPEKENANANKNSSALSPQR